MSLTKNQSELVAAVQRQNYKTAEALRRLVTDHLARGKVLEDRLTKAGLRTPLGPGQYVKNDRSIWRVVDKMTDMLTVHPDLPDGADPPAVPQYDRCDPNWDPPKSPSGSPTPH
ncbi:putative B2-like protein [Mayapan virus]|nr:putative B2-like protein [Mayapan virus]